MIVAGVVVAAVAAFVLSSAYYAAVTPLERRALGAAALDRGRPQAWKVLAELLRTAVVASVFGWLASRAALESLPGSLGLAVALWAGFAVVLLTGSVIWERVPAITAAMHAGDWLLKLALLAVVIGLLH
ncbi:MAG: DUF1761 domain-containing protein [Actinomycetota bacterium]